MSEEATGAPAPTQQDSKPIGTELMKMPSNALARIVTDMGTMQVFAKAVYESGWFKCKTGYAAMMVVDTMLAERLSAMEFLKRYWVTDTGPTLKNEYLLAEFNLNHGKSQMIACTPDRACIELKKGRDKPQVFEFTWEEAQKEKYIWTKEAVKGEVKKHLPDGTVNPAALKDNWATPRGRAEMMWWRVVSFGLSKVCPEVTGGYPVYEESDEYVDAEVVAVPAAKSNLDPVAPDGRHNPPPAQAAQEPAKETSAPAAETVSSSASPALAGTPPPDTAVHANGVATGQANAALPTLGQVMEMTDGDRKTALMARLRELFDKLVAKGLLTKDRYDAVLQNKYRVSTAKALDVEQLSQLVFNMNKKLADSEQAADLDQWGNKATGLTPASP